MSKKLVSADALHAKWMKKPRYRKAYDDLEVSVGLDDDDLKGARGTYEDEDGSRRVYGNARRPAARKK